MLDFDTPTQLTMTDLSAILSADDWVALTERARAMLAPMGASDFMLRFDTDGNGQGPHCHAVGTLPEPLLRMFANAEHVRTDPIFRQFADSSLPLAWQPSQVEAQDGHSVYRLLHAMDIRHALSVVLRGAHGTSRIDFYGTRLGAFTTSAGQHAAFVLLGLYLHEAVETLWRRCKPQPAPLLSERELECLDWSAGGKTSREVGAILGISQRTVYFHLNNVAAKLNVYGTRHAISRAIMLGILQPRR
jgi:DNA-binding CsgD family transcriptional regulator